MQQEKPVVLVWGEVLWDCLPEGLFLGGAPFNVGYHLRQLGLRVEVVSAVGADFLGEQILRRAYRAGLGKSFLQTSAGLPTGWVEVELDEQRNAKYRIVENVAWDAISLNEELLACAASADAVVYGSLAQRGQTNRTNLASVLDAAGGWKIMDVNLRPPYDDKKLVLEWAKRADLLKMNEEELVALSGCAEGWREGCAILAGRTGVEKICITKGRDGAVFWTPEFVAEGRSEAVEVRDTIGAGDAFMAMLVQQALEGSLETKNGAGRALDKACRLGAFVASRSGATPAYEWSEE